MNKKTLMSVGRTAAMGSMLLFGGAFIAGCGDETTEVTEKLGLAVVEEGEEMPECTAENEGDMIYVKDEKQTYACEDEEWVSLKGEAGTSCTAKQLKDKSGYEIICGGEKVGTIKNGENGEKGDEGEAGASCSAKELKDKSGFELTCNGKKVGTIKNGDDGDEGAAGTSCTGKANEDGSVTISCDGEVVGTIENGNDGKSCKAEAVENGVKVTCEGSEPVTIKNGDAGTSCTGKPVTDGIEVTCGGTVVGTIKNGDAGEGCTVKAGTYADTVVCGENRALMYKAVCNDGQPYDPNTQFCYEETSYKVDEDGVKRLHSYVGERCHTWNATDKKDHWNEPYDPRAYFCENGVRTAKCVVYKEGSTTETEKVAYNSETQYCDTKTKKVKDFDYCDVAKTMAYKGDYEYCYRTNDNPEIKIADKLECGGADKLYNPVTHFCDNAETKHITTKAMCGSTDELNIDVRHTAGAVDIYGDGAICDTYEGVTQLYKIKKIDDQVWMAQNLNRRYTQATSGTSALHLDSTSFCYGDGMKDNNGDAVYTAAEVAANCAKYGRLYTWSAAVDSAKLYAADPDNHEYCGYVTGAVCTTPGTANYQGICPDGWHLPTKTEADNLMAMSTYPYNFKVDDQTMYNIMAAGDVDWTKLEWDYGESTTYLGTNSVGFAALPSGYKAYLSSKGWYYSDSKTWFGFWTTTTHSTISNEAYDFYISDNSMNVASTAKSNALSIRCVKNAAE